MENVITGIVSSGITLIGSYFVFKQNDKGNQLKYITEERQKWREQIRELSVDFLSHPFKKDGTKAADIDILFLKRIRSNIALRLNPDDVEDKKILEKMNNYIMLFENNNSIEAQLVNGQIEIAFAHLLKHDWERAKQESFHSKSINPLNVISLAILFGILINLYCDIIDSAYCPYSWYRILINKIALLVVLYLVYYCIKKVLAYVNCAIGKSFIKSSSLTKLLGLTIRTKIQ